jgi:ABC-type multidrug transport system ATPase subunit
MKQKLALCCALIHAPSVLFLDEPTTGVDPVSRRDFWTILGRIRHSGVTVVVSTPYMDEAARCDRVALIKGGRFIALDSVPALLARHGTLTYAVRGADRARLLHDLRRFPDTQYCFAFGQEHHIVLRADARGPGALEGYLAQLGHPGVAIRRIEPNIEDVYINLTRGPSHV